MIVRVVFLNNFVALLFTLTDMVIADFVVGTLRCGTARLQYGGRQ